MKRTISVTLNDVPVTQMSDKIIAVRVEEQPLQSELITETNGILSGKSIVRTKRADLTLSVFVKIRELYDMTARMEAINALNSWAAGGGALKVSYRPGMLLNVVLLKPAAPGNIRSYNDEIELAFASDGLPYWTDTSQTVYSITQGAGTVFVPGNAETAIDANIICDTAVNDLTLQIDGKALILTDIGASSGDVIVITHNNYGRMSVKNGSVSLINKLSPSSYDCLIVHAQTRDYTFYASGSARLVLMIKGRWL